MFFKFLEAEPKNYENKSSLSAILEHFRDKYYRHFFYLSQKSQNYHFRSANLHQKLINV